MAGPAQAIEVPDCGGAYQIETYTVRFENGRIILDPNGVPSDVQTVRALVNIVLRTALCYEDGKVTGPTFCVVNLAQEIAASLDPANGNLRYVYRDPSGAIVIDYALLLADLGRCP